MSTDELPCKWVYTSISEICETTSGGTPSRKVTEYYGGSIPWIKSGELRDNPIYSADESITQIGLKNSSAKVFPSGTLLIALYGATVGRLGVLEIDAATNQAICGISTPQDIQQGYVYWYLYYSRRNLLNARIGGAQPNISQKILRGLPIPLPPYNEQEQIVAKIEELFTNLDAGVEALKKVQAQIKRYRQAVLKYAFEGKLTAEWREAHKDEQEPASVLMERIREERKKKLGGKYKEPPAIDTSNLPVLPDGWQWVNFQQIADGSRNAMKAGPFGSALKKEYYVKSGYKIYGQEQVIRGDPHYGDYYIDEKRYRTLESCTVQPGDVLISLVGTIGKVLILPEDIEPGILNPRLVKITLDQAVAKPRYIKAFIESGVVRHFFSLGSHGGTMDILNLTILKGLPIPLPPVVEQGMLLEEIERRLSISDAIDKMLQQGLQQSDRLRQGILKKAFEGKLVPQDPNDEPADKLLERIREERAKQTAGAKKTRGRKKS